MYIHIYIYTPGEIPFVHMKRSRMFYCGRFAALASHSVSGRIGGIPSTICSEAPEHMKRFRDVAAGCETFRATKRVDTLART